MATRPQADIDRLLAANANAYDPVTNPGGLGRLGYITNFPANLKSSVAISDYILAMLTEVEADKVATAADRLATGQDRAATAADRVVTGQDRTAAASSATASASSATALTATSTTSQTIAVGSRSFTTQAGKQFGVGQRLNITDNASPTTRIMYGMVTAYSGTTLTVNVDNVVGSGAYANWTIRLGGERGAQGPISSLAPAVAYDNQLHYGS